MNRDESIGSGGPIEPEILPSQEEIASSEDGPERVERKIRISLEKLSGYPDDQLLAVYPEYAFNRSDIQKGEPLVVMSVAEIRARVLAMSNSQTNSAGEWVGGELYPQGIIIVYDDLPPGTTSEKARKRWVEFHRHIRERKNEDDGDFLSSITTPEYRSAIIEEAKFSGLNELRGLREDHVIAIRLIHDDHLFTVTVGELRRAIETMEDPTNEVSFGGELRFFIDAYEHSELFVERARTEVTIRDAGVRNEYLQLVASYADDELITWVHPNELHDFATGRKMIMQNTAGALRRRLREADHHELEWFAHAGGLRIVAIGDVDLETLGREFHEAEAVFHDAVEEIVDRMSDEREVRVRDRMKGEKRKERIRIRQEKRGI
ncbi:MAG: hypothetical protein WC726_02970 [Parcubacteria group bacterium]|jgi:hypothetical protein